MRAVVNAKDCVSCGLCADICPAVFEMQDVAVVKVDPVPAASENDCREAARSCPVEAIHLHE